MFKKANPKQNFPEMEREMMKYWKDNKIFEKSVDGEEKKPTYSFFDGPPFATGLPHYGHVVASLMKDVVPRFWTMKGKRVERRWGWDCHGLPIENMIEKEHNIKNKKDIEKWGVDKFNEACHSSVLRYADEWKKFIPRVGRWVDMDNDYKTMDWKYTESIWWVFSELYKKGLVYEGHKAMHICPRCETSLSNFEVTQAYKTVKDLSATAKFKLKPGQKIGNITTDENTYILAWTTTPWTLIGNVALAVGEDIEYIIVKDIHIPTRHLEPLGISTPPASEIVKDYLIVSKDSFEKVKRNFKNKDAEVITAFKGKDLVGLEYEPLFDYYAKDEKLDNRENGWKIYAGDFVTTEEGTGVVHIAPAFGEDDMKLGQKYNLPFVQHVGMDGIIKKEAGEFAGLKVKSIESGQNTDIEIIKFLAHNGKLFAKEKYEHSYPHCWRCDTPLINYATSSWFVKVTDIKDKMIKNNKKIRWVPEYIKEGRFGKWLEDARDWAVSRSRFWGAPLPVWKCKDCGEKQVLGSIDDLRNRTDKKITKFIFLRHGESEGNLKNIKASQLEGYPLTKKGIKQSKDAAKLLANEKINVMISSPILRAKQTAEILSKILGMEFIEDVRIREFDFGSWNGHNSKDLFCTQNKAYLEYKKLDNGEEKYNFKLGGDGESRKEIEARVRKFIEEISEKYEGKNILVVGHGGVNAMFCKAIDNLSIKETYKQEFMLGNAQMNLFYIDGKKKRFDLHKPNIDGVKIKCAKCGGNAEIVGDVFDCWFESGSMPYAQHHYPFENAGKFEKGFPADFIAEGLDQTRGWFYTLIVLSTALFDKPAFKNVTVNGIVLAEDGQKMSKRLKNYPEPNLLIEKYGADSLRYYLLSSPVMKGENLNFSEKGVEEVLKRFILILWNAYSFLVMNLDLAKIEAKDLESKKTSNNFLDKWIISELNMLIKEVGEEMESYDLVKASRRLRDFTDKLSNWYIRRSRKRFSSESDVTDRMNAFRTLYKVMVEYSKVMAPFMPFLADEMFRNLTGKESVHLEEFPEHNKKKIDIEINRKMEVVREIVTLGLAIRAKSGIKVRMPLGKLQITNYKLQIEEQLLDLIKDELNIKEIEFVESISEKEGWAFEKNTSGLQVALNLEITPELEVEGYSREIIRHIQTMRKEAKYDRNDKIAVAYSLEGGNELIENIMKNWKEVIKKDCLATNIFRMEPLIKENFDMVKDLKIKDAKVMFGVKKT